MTTQTAQISTVSGLSSLTAKLFAPTGDTVIYTSDSVTERTNAKGVYVCTFGESAVISGDYRLILFNASSIPLASGLRTFAGTDGEVASEVATVNLTSPAITAIGTAFLSHVLTKGTAGTIERAFWQILKTQASVDGAVVDNAANTASRFNTGLTGSDGQYDHQLIVFVSGDLEGESRPIDSFSSTGGVIVLQEPFTAEPAADDEFLILPSHVHPIDEIQAGLARTGNDGDTLETLSDQIDGISVGTGTGARTVTITVNDGTTALQNARVRLTEGANTYTGTTNASGVVVFNVDDASYTVAITKSGYSYSGTTLVVDGDETASYSMTAITVSPPDDPALCAVTIPIVDQYGAALADEVVEIRFNEFTSTADTTALVLSPPPTLTSDAEGLIEVNLLREAKYSVFYGQDDYKRRLDFTVPDAGSFTVGE